MLSCAAENGTELIIRSGRDGYFNWKGRVSVRMSIIGGSEKFVALKKKRSQLY